MGGGSFYPQPFRVRRGFHLAKPERKKQQSGMGRMERIRSYSTC